MFGGDRCRVWNRPESFHAACFCINLHSRSDLDREGATNYNVIAVLSTVRVMLTACIGDNVLCQLIHQALNSLLYQ
jgi:hypothetical protein